MEQASEEANRLLNQINAYRTYEASCLKKMSGSTPSISITDELNKKVRKFLNRKQKAINKNPVKLNADKLIKKNILFMDDPTTPKQFAFNYFMFKFNFRVAKYSVIITPTDEPGSYKFESVLNGETKQTKLIDFEELLRRESACQFRMEFDQPLSLDVQGTRRYLDRKFHFKNLI